jgi:hypothetical protein
MNTFTSALPGKTRLGAGDGLHEVVRLHRLVDVNRRQALDVEAGLHHHPVRDDV